MVEEDRTGYCRSCKYFGWLITIFLWWNKSKGVTVRIVFCVADNSIVMVEQDRTGDCRICEYIVCLIKKLLWWNRSEQLTVRVVSILVG
jgi:hypothetical protein